MDKLPLSDFPELSFSFAEPANNLFAGWLVSVKQQAPHRLNREAAQHHNPTNDVRGAVLKAWQYIAEKEPYKRTDEAWCQGFLKGFMQSNLSVLWSGEFLEPNLAHKNALWLKAMLLYLDHRQEARLHVNRLYQRLLDDGSASLLLNEEDQLKAHHLVSDLQANENWQRGKLYLEEHLLTDITKAVRDEEGVDTPEVDEYFSRAAITELVNLNPYL